MNHRLRALFGTTDADNGVYGSDSPSSAERDIALFFDDASRYPEGVKKGASHPRLISHELEYKSAKNSARASVSSAQKASTKEGTKTLAIVKPDAYSADHLQEIVDIILEHGFTIVDEKEDKWSLEKAEEFYKEHNGKPFFKDLTEWMSR